jgi:hypothetical protein
MCFSPFFPVEVNGKVYTVHTKKLIFIVLVLSMCFQLLRMRLALLMFLFPPSGNWAAEKKKKEIFIIRFGFTFNLENFFSTPNGECTFFELALAWLGMQFCTVDLSVVLFC